MVVSLATILFFSEIMPVQTRVKVTLLGDCGVGKSCLIASFLDGRPCLGEPSTLLVDYRYCYYKGVKLLVWDTAGQVT